MDKPEIIPDAQNVQLRLLFSVGFTDRGQVGVYFHAGPWLERIKEMHPNMKQLTVDQIITAVTNSLDRRIPRIIKVS